MSTDPNRADPDVVSAVWARTTPSTGRAFVPVLEIDGNTRVRISPARAAEHATAVSAAIARAEHDAFVVRQLRFLVKGAPGLADEEVDEYVGQVVLKLRSDRRPIVWPTPLRLEPGVSAFTGEPFLTVFVDVRAVGQWDMDDARRHVAHVFEVLEGARLDGAYLQTLIRRFDLDESTARRLVACLAETPPQRGEGS